MAARHSPAYPHDPIEELFPGLFMVRGSFPLNPLMRITRNMAIVRHAGELTLIDPIRLDAEGEEALRALGEVKRILRLGFMHGLDDPYYAEVFGAELWAQERSESIRCSSPTSFSTRARSCLSPMPSSSASRARSTASRRCW